MNWRTKLLDLLFPPKCVFCGGLLEQSGALMCPKCQKTLPWLIGTAAERKISFVEKCASPLQYKENVRESIHRFKFNGRSWYAQNYGVLMAQCVQDHLSGEYDLISWVPVSKKRKRHRGYDQSFLLASEMGKNLGEIPIALLKKVKDNPPQSGQESESERRRNVKDVYDVPYPERLAGKRILLVDDIVTTGETLSECARTLRMAGAEKVVCVTLSSTSGNEL